MIRHVLIGGAIGAALGGAYALLRGEPKIAPAPLRVPAPKDEPAAPVTLPDCPPKGVRVLLIGDSYAVGFAPYLGKHATRCQTPYHHAAVEGSNISKWQRDSWLGPALAAIKPHVVLISQGGNDFGRSDALTVRAHIHELLKKIRAAGARPLWISPPTTPFPDKIGVRDMWKKAIGDEWFDSTVLLIPRAPGDPLGHPTASGYKLWADAIWPWMSPQLSMRPG